MCHAKIRDHLLDYCPGGRSTRCQWCRWRSSLDCSCAAGSCLDLHHYLVCERKTWAACGLNPPKEKSQVFTAEPNEDHYLTDHQEVIAGLRGVSKSFGGTVAVDDVSFDLRPGEVLALLGENGAGKSTCVKLLAGVYRPDRGHLFLEGYPLELHSPLEAHRRGIAVMHQHP